MPPDGSGCIALLITSPLLSATPRTRTRFHSCIDSRAPSPQVAALTTCSHLFICTWKSAAKSYNLATRQSPRLQRRGMENGHVANGKALANGHAIMGETLQKIESNIQNQENIFLFIPNLIGKQCIATTVLPSDPYRLRSDCPCHLLPLLHATSSANVFLSIQSIMYSRCPGWTSRAALQPVHDLRRGSRHGHR